MATKGVHIRLDEKRKRRLEQLFAQMGLDIPTAVRMFFSKVEMTGDIPFLVGTTDPAGDYYTPEQVAQIDREAREAKRGINVSREFDSMEDMIADLNTDT